MTPSSPALRCRGGGRRGGEIEGPADKAAAGGASDSAAITAWLFRANEEPRRITLDALPELIADDQNLAWVDLSGYGESDLRAVADLIRLHHGVPHAILAPWRRPRLEVFNDHFFASTTIAQADNGNYRIAAGDST